MRTQEYIWSMVSSLSTGGFLPFFFYRMLTSAKCIIWIVVAATVEVTIVVSLFLFLDNTAFMPTFFIFQVFFALNLNGEYLSPNV
jgi:hypothetical protein